MKKLFALLLAVSMLAVFALPAAATAAQIRDVLRLTNNERRMNFRPALRESAALNAAAAVRAREIAQSAQTWSHTRPNGTNWSTVLAQHNVTGWAHASENLARISGGTNPSAASRAVSSWMNSTTGHREALLRPDLTHVGHGVHRHVAVNGTVTYFWAQIFIHDGSSNNLGLWDIIVGVVLNLLRMVGF